MDSCMDSGRPDRPTRGESSVRRVLPWVWRAIPAVAFLYAGTLKTIDPAAFASQIHPYRLLPDPAVNLAALALPWIEILGALALLFIPRLRRAGALLLSVLLMLFLAAQASALLRGLEISCGCFSAATSNERIGTIFLLREAALLVCAVRAWRTSAEPKTAVS